MHNHSLLCSLINELESVVTVLGGGTYWYFLIKLTCFVFQMGDWIHCNNCFLRPGTAPVQFRLTTCGHIYCDACVENGNYTVPSFCFHLFFLNWFRGSGPRIRLWSLNVYNCGVFWIFFFFMYNRYSLILRQATCIINNLHVNCHTSPSYSGSFKF